MTLWNAIFDELFLPMLFRIPRLKGPAEIPLFNRGISRKEKVPVPEHN